MGVLASLVPKAQPALYGGGVNAPATEGATWSWSWVEVEDNNGDPIDLSGVTGTCKVLTNVGGSVVATLAFDGNADGSFTVSLDEADTAGLGAGVTQGRRCVWSLTFADGTDVVQVWGPINSRFTINPAGS